MALFLETIHGDVVIDLNINDGTIQPQVHNALALADCQFLSKLHTFASPALHFQYSTSNFIFFGDPTYTGKGGQSAVSLLNQIEPTNPLASKFSTIKAIDHTVNGGNFTTQQHHTTQRRKKIKDGLEAARNQVQTWVQTHPHGQQSTPTPLPPILLVSIPHANGEVSSLFGIYCTLPAKQYWFGTDDKGEGEEHNNNPLLDPMATFPENLYDYVIGTVTEGHEVIYQLFSQTLPSPLLAIHPTANTNPFFSPISATTSVSSTRNDSNSNTQHIGIHNQYGNNNNNNNNSSSSSPSSSSPIPILPEPRGDMILQTITIHSPFQSLTTPDRLQQLVIPHHNKKLIQALRATKQSAFDQAMVAQGQATASSSTTMSDGPGTNQQPDGGEVINLGSYMKTDGTANVEAEMLFLDSFNYNPKPQHYPSFLKTTAKLANNGFVSPYGDAVHNNTNNYHHLSQTTLDTISNKLSHYGYPITAKATVGPAHTDGGMDMTNGGAAVIDEDDDDDDNNNNNGSRGGDDGQVQIQIRMEEPKNGLFVSNLSPNSTKESISAHFAAQTIVLSVDLIKERLGQNWKCYAFVDVATESQCDVAVTQLNKTMLDGYTINVGYRHGAAGGAGLGGVGGGSNDIYFTIHTDQSQFFSKRPKRTTLASSIVAGGGAGSLGGSGGK